MIPPGTTEAFAKYVKDHPDLVSRIPDEPGPSVPVPISYVTAEGERRVAMALVYYIVRPEDRARRLYRVSPPEYHVVVDFHSRKLISVKELSPGDLGPRWDATRPLGVYQAPEDLTMEVFKEKRTRFFFHYDWIIHAYTANKTALSPAERRDLADFSKLLVDLVHPPMLPYVKALNPDFFAWVDRALNSFDRS